MRHINGKEPGSRDAPHGETYEENGTSPDGPARQEWVVCFGVPYSTSFANKVGPDRMRAGQDQIGSWSYAVTSEHNNAPANTVLFSESQDRYGFFGYRARCIAVIKASSVMSATDSETASSMTNTIFSS